MATARSKYDLSPIQSSYVDPGSVQVASILRQRYDENKEKYDLINRAAKNLKVGAGDQHLKDAAIDAINDGINNAATGAESYEMLGSTIDNLATNFATNEGLQVANESYNNRQTELALQAEMRAKGMQVLDFGAIYDETGQVVGHSFDNHNSYWTDDDGTVHTNVYQAGSEHQLDYGMKMKQLIGTIAKDGTTLTRLSGELAGFMEYKTGVGQTKVNRIATQLFDTYMETDEGMQQMRKLTQIDGLSLEEAQDEIISEMIAVAQPQVGWVPQYMKDPQYVAGGGASGFSAALESSIEGLRQDMQSMRKDNQSYFGFGGAVSADIGTKVESKIVSNLKG